MARRRGFFAELAHQQQVAARKREQAARAAFRAHAAAVRQAEAAHRQAVAAQQKAARTQAADQRAAAKEAQRLIDESMNAEAAARNAALAADYEEIDTILAATLAVDDWVDLDRLRIVPDQPPFPHPELQTPTPPPPPIPVPPEPQYVEPPKPSGLFVKHKHERAIAETQAAFAQAHQAWQAEAAQVPERQRIQGETYRAQEADRLARLAAAAEAHRVACDRADTEAAEANRELDELIAGVAYGTEDAVQEYVGIVLGNSVYPEAFSVRHEYTFSSQLRELDLTVLVPAPEEIPTAKEYKYVKARGELTTVELPKGQRKERYTHAVHQVALRSLHEVFEADRAGWVQSISLTVTVESVDPATGHAMRTPLVAVASSRDGFSGIDLANVVPLATLQHFGALVSKNPFDLVPVEITRGVRRQ